MSKFFMLSMAFIFSVLVLSLSNMFHNNSSASTFKSGLETYLQVKASRAPSIVTNQGK